MTGSIYGIFSIQFSILHTIRHEELNTIIVSTLNEKIRRFALLLMRVGIVLAISFLIYRRIDNFSPQLLNTSILLTKSENTDDRIKELPGTSIALSEIISPENPTKAKLSSRKEVYYLFEFCFLAIILYICIFTLIQYFQNKDAPYLFYSFYLFTTFVYFARRFPSFLRLVLDSAQIKVIKNWLGFHDTPDVSAFSKTELTVAMMLIITYLLFFQKFFNLKINFPRFSRAFNLGYYLILMLIIIDWILLYTIGKSKIFEMSCKFGLATPGIYVLYRVFQKRILLYNYIVIGSAALMTGAAITGLLFIVQTLFKSREALDYLASLVPFKFLPFQIGVLIEILFFTAALGFKTKIAETEKADTQKQNYELKLKQIESDMQVLKSQIGSHFTSRCLATLHLLLRENKYEEAKEYLQRFSSLLRIVMENMDKSRLSIEKELAICEAYLHLESLQFADDFRYETVKEPTVDWSFVEIPSFTLQPFVENAIQHGLLQKIGAKDLIIRMEKHPEIVRCIIEDNGIGRKAAERKKSQSVNPHRSVGISNTTDRLKLYEHSSGNKVTARLIDLFDTDGKAAGTRVEIDIEQ